LIVANALRTGFTHQDTDIDPQNNPPPEISKAYDALRDVIEAIDGAGGAAFTELKQIELNLFRLNDAKEFQGIEIETPDSDLAVKARALLEAIERYAPNWRQEITAYGRRK
jgi:hypothetical protein